MMPTDTKVCVMVSVYSARQREDCGVNVGNAVTPPKTIIINVSVQMCIRCFYVFQIHLCTICAFLHVAGVL